jgi:hypothetical protein
MECILCSVYSIWVEMQCALTRRSPLQHAVSPALSASALSYEVNASHSKLCLPKTAQLVCQRQKLHRTAGAVKMRRAKPSGPRGPVTKRCPRFHVDLLRGRPRPEPLHIFPGAYSNPDERWRQMHRLTSPLGRLPMYAICAAARVV